MPCTTAKLVGVLAALAMALATPAALATPGGHNHGKPVRHAAVKQTAKSSPNIGNCAVEPDYVYAGAQCDPAQGASGGDATAGTANARTTITVTPADVTAWNCSLEYEYVYAGAQCVHAMSSGTAGTVVAG